VQTQHYELEMGHGNNPPDGFLQHQSGLQPPPGVCFCLGGGISLIPDVVALFLPTLFHHKTTTPAGADFYAV
jgi:hypothetical protein